MRKLTLIVVALVILLSFSFNSVFAQEEEKKEKVFERGTVWNVTMVKTEANMGEKYLEDLSRIWRKVMDEALAQGLILSYKILWGSAANPDDWDMLLLVEFKNFAALDVPDEAWDALSEKIFETEEEWLKANVKRSKLREIFGGKMLQEIIFK